MLKITDKSFRYTPSYETDLRKKFRKIEQERKAAEAAARQKARAQAEELEKSVVTMASRRTLHLPKQ
jgi:hypothetical protein